MSSSRHAWIDASAGVAGDMLLGALIDAGADLAVVQQAVDAVIADSVRLASTASDPSRTARKPDIGRGDRRTMFRFGHGGWSKDLIATQILPPRSAIERSRPSADSPRPRDESTTCHRSEVHFHEVGALDSIADIVGVAAALHSLGIDSISASAVAVGSGRVRGAHGDMGVPVPAVVELAAGWKIFAGGSGELTTPTGMALVSAPGRAVRRPADAHPAGFRGWRRQPRYARSPEPDSGTHR